MTRRQRITVAAVAVLAVGGTAIGLAVSSSTNTPLAKKAPKVPTTVAQCGSSQFGPIVDGETLNEPQGVGITMTQPLELNHCTGVTIDGGDWFWPSKSPGKGAGHGVTPGISAFDVTSGTGNTIENLSVQGANEGGYVAKLANSAAINLNGSIGTTISNVQTSHAFGDCLDLEGLRSGSGADAVTQPVTNLTVTTFGATACGRNNISLVSVDGANLSALTLGSAGYDALDFEDDSGGESARNVVVSDCVFDRYINISAPLSTEGTISISGCAEQGADAGEAVIVKERPDAANGPITINNDILKCGASAYVACIQQGGGNLTVSNTAITIGFKGDAVHEPAYHVGNDGTLTLSGDTVSGYYKPGTVGNGGKVIGTL